MAYNPTGGQTYSLAASISSTQNTILLSSFLEPVTNIPYTMSYLNSVIEYATLAPKTTQTEFISFTGITQNPDGTATLTGVVRGLSRSYPFTSSAAYMLPHGGTTSMVLSNSPQQIAEYAALRDNEVITGDWQVPDPVNAMSIANKEYVLSVVSGGPVSFQKVVVNATAGTTVSIGQLVYFDTASGTWLLCNATNVATVNDVKKGIAQGAGTIGNPITGGVLIYGLDTNQTGLTAGNLQYASNTPGAISPTTGTTESVIGIAYSPTQIYFDPYFYYTLTASQKSQLSGAQPSVTVYSTVNSVIGSSTTQFDISNTSGNTYRYTWTGTGTDPVINPTTFPVNSSIYFKTQNFTANNNGLYVVTGSGTNYVEVTNPSGIVENNKTIGTGYIVPGISWMRPTNFSYVEVEVVGGGGASASATTSGTSSVATGGGAGGGYSRRFFPSSFFDQYSPMVVGAGGISGGASAQDSGFVGMIATGSGSGTTSQGGIPEAVVGGDVNIEGQGGGAGASLGSTIVFPSGIGGSSVLGGGAPAVSNNMNGIAGSVYGGGASGCSITGTGGGAGASGANGAQGVVIVTVYA